MTGPPDVAAIDEDLAAFGFKREPGTKIVDDELRVWPEHWRVTEVAAAMMSQLNVAGMGAVVGYRYESVPTVLQALVVAPDDWRDMFWDFRTIEGEVARRLNKRD